ncbi:MAG: hypothetical protein ACKV0T_19815 [Planctomycetales bacterium]
MTRIRKRQAASRHNRRGAATLDYVLVLGAALPLAGGAIYYSGRILKAVYEFACVHISWPFM